MLNDADIVGSLLPAVKLLPPYCYGNGLWLFRFAFCYFNKPNIFFKGGLCPYGKGNVMEKQKGFLSRVVENRYFCMFWLFLAVGFITWFGALKVEYLGVSYPRFEKTASVIAMGHPKLYYLWVIFMIAALWLNINYMYRRYDYNGKVGKVSMYLSFICIIVTKIVPHEDDFNWRMVVHWSAALLFGTFGAAAVIVFLFSRAKENKRMLVTMLLFIALLAIMIVLLLLFGENGAIETLPIWGVFLILFLLNFTDVYEKKTLKES
jgi:hypothetical protein